MGTEIKTRRGRRDIKVLDKSATVVERIRQSHVRTKENTAQTQEHAAPVEYAGDRVVGGMDTAVRKGVHHTRAQGGRLVREVRGKLRYSKEIKKRKEEIQKERAGASPGERQPSPASGGEMDSPPGEQMKRKAQSQTAKGRAQQKAQREMGQKTSGQMSKGMDASKNALEGADQRKNGIKTTRQVGQKSIKNAGKSVKTGRRSARTTIKTTERAAKQAHRTAKASRETAKKAAQGVKQSAKAAKKAAKVSARAVKAIIAATKSLVTALVSFGWIAILVLIIVILFGGFLCMTGGDNATTVSPVSAEVQAYEPVIRKYAKQYGIGEYVELIKAVMMQESGGRGNDPMQSSEGSFNTKFPRQPGGITDPEYSIQCGVQEIKACLVSAEVKSPLDMDNIKLALQGYNYGNGYIQWAINHYGGYTLANAAEFSDKMAKEKGWGSYGDKQYVPHVLRYYSLGRIPNDKGNQAIVQVALSQEGNGGDTYWSWYGFGSRVSWCACFVSWCGEQCGYLESGVMPKFSLCSDGAKWFQNKGQFKDGSDIPAAGDIIFFDRGSDGSIDHVGIVESVKKGTVNTVEGNSGDAVRRRSYPIGDSEIYGYGIY